MAVLAQYTPPSDSQYGRSANEFFSGLNEGTSLMERKQAMALRQQQADQQRMEFIAKLPLIQAQTELTQTAAKSAVDNAVTTTNLETKAAVESVGAQKEFQDAMQYDASFDIGASDGSPEGDAAQAEAAKAATQKTLETRAQKLAALSAKYAYMGGLKNAGYSGFVNSINKAWGATNEQLHAYLGFETQLQRAKETADAGITREQIKASAKTTTADTYTASRERIAQINNDTKLTLQEKSAKIAQEKTGATLADLQGRAADADQAAAEASASGDEQAAATHRQVASSYRDAIQKLTTYAGTSPLPVPKSSPSVPLGPAETGAISAEQAAARDVVDNPPSPTEAASLVETSHPSPVKVTSWSQAKALKSGTQYIGPDGVLYTRK